MKKRKTSKLRDSVWSERNPQ